MQYEGSRRDRVPLVAFDSDARLAHAQASDEVSRRLRQYADSVSFDGSHWDNHLLALGNRT